MDEQKYAVLLTDKQVVKTLECDPQEELFQIARSAIGCEWIELVETDSLQRNNLLMLIDEEGKLHEGEKRINCIASDLYASDQHGDPIVGNALIVKAEDERLVLLTADEAKNLSVQLQQQREQSVAKIAAAFHLQPTIHKKKDPERSHQRQTCTKAEMER